MNIKKDNRNRASKKNTDEALQVQALQESIHRRNRGLGKASEDI